ncbi:hypothetical protein PR202_ga27738 [Eleusine coracana subsp. coracana]|uniref:Uncharacterized protein n=1 Tax=Eleusine coracana subsp. coracana TaxID=191504 RepID=A0AAV5DGQ7_ELECO|nr:hypothetical protein PR202_ga27738 [Eleusine coracana subsp. coracana]
MEPAAADEGKPAAAPSPGLRAAISHVIFDMDGLLLDTEGMYTAVQEKILARYGKVFDWSIKARTMGKTTAESTRIFFEMCGLDGLLTPDQFLQERDSMLQELLPSCSPMPDAPLGVAAAKTAGMNVVMVPDPRLDKSCQKGADQVLGSLQDFNPREWGLPPFED